MELTLSQHPSKLDQFLLIADDGLLTGTHYQRRALAYRLKSWDAPFALQTHDLCCENAATANPAGQR